MSDFPRPCQCSHLHFATCPHCGCADPVEDDGGFGDTRYPPPDFRADAYTGIYGSDKRWEKP